MDEVTAKFIYQPNTVLGILLLFVFIASIVKPQLLTSLAIGILLIRPNERIEFNIPFIQIVLPVLFIVLMVNSKHLIHIIHNKPEKYLFFFIALISIQTIILHPSDIIKNIMWMLPGILLYCAIITFIDNDIGAKYICYAVIISCFIICFEPIYYHYTELQGSEIWNKFHLAKSGRLQAWGMWANANETAFIACIAVANILLIAIKFKNKAFYVATVLLVPFFILVVFLTASRAGLVSLLLIFSPSILFIEKTSKKIIITALIFCVIVVSQSLTPERTDTEGSTQEREDLRYRGKHLFLEYPLMGVGFDRARYEMGSAPVHNTYIQAFAETGIFGGILFMSYLYNFGRKLYFNLKNSNTSTRNILIAVIGFFCSSTFYFLFGNQLLSIMFFLIMAQITTFVNNTGEVSSLH